VNPESPYWETLKSRAPGYCDIGCGPGWDNLLRMIDGALKEIDPDYQIMQIKEKFGGLRYYTNLSERLTDEQRNQVYEIERTAEALSFCLCEQCGTTNEVETKGWGGGYWILTLCQQCGAKQIENRRAQSRALMGQTDDGPSESSTVSDAGA
jgi:hypothetical protein